MFACPVVTCRASLLNAPLMLVFAALLVQERLAYRQSKQQLQQVDKDVSRAGMAQHVQLEHKEQPAEACVEHLCVQQGSGDQHAGGG